MNIDQSWLGKGRITFRSILIGVVLIPLNYLWIVQLELVRYSLVTYLVPYYTVIFIITVLILCNGSLGKFSPRLRLTYPELAVIYIILSVTTGFCSHNMMQILVSSMGHAFWFATPENDWANIFWRYIPRWLTVDDKAVLRDFYAGDSTLYAMGHINGWLVPALAWTGFATALVIAVLCINVLIRKQWSDRERLTYPIIQLPMAMMNPKSRFFSNRLMWFGFAVAAGISLLNGLHELYPAVPHLRVTRLWLRDTGYFTSEPWNHIMRLAVIAFYPFAIGIGFVIPLDLAFSVWFFYIFQKIVAGVGLSLGLRHDFPYLNDQMLGAYIGLGCIAIWLGRAHFKRIVGHLISPKRMDDANEPIPYRLAFPLMIFAFIGLGVFSVMAGMTVWVALLFFVVYFIFSMTVTRIHAELGYPVHDMEHTSPQHLLLTSVGTSNLGPSTLTVMAIYRWFNRTYASHPMPHHLDGFQIGKALNIRWRQLTVIILGVTVIGLLGSFWTLMHTYYRLGGESGRMGWPAQGFGRETFTYLQRWMYYPSGPNHAGILAMPVGFLMVIFLAVMRSRFFWWPFHPLGYPIVISFGGRMLWVCLLISSTVKFLVFRTGGWQAYRKMVPFFLGLTLGDFTMGSIWSLVGMALGIKTYDFWP